MDNISIVWDFNGVLFKEFKLDSRTFEFVKVLNNRGFVQYALTNTHLWRLEQYKRKYLIQNHFKKIYSTKEIGLNKTDPKVFLSLKVEVTNKILMIDDKQENLLVPKFMGAETILYVDDIQLKEAFKLLGIF